MQDIFLLKLGEVVLKGANRHAFENKLKTNISRRIRSIGNFEVYSRQSTIYVEPKDDLSDMDEAFEAGNILCAAGLEVVLKGEKPEKLTAERVAELVSLYINTAKEAREKVNPKLKDIENMSDEEFLKVLPNYCSLR